MRLIARLTVAALPLALGACNTADRLANIGATPALSEIQDPTAQPGYKPVRMPMPDVQPVSYAPNSLWRTGSRAFFKDQRAAKVGDLLTVNVAVTDQANISNETKRTRANTESFGLPNAAGLENSTAGKAFGVGGTALLNATSATSNDGLGSVQRAETVTTNIAAVVTQVLPNGNLVVEGKQEIRINFEVRELVVAGVVRPEDIAADNTIDSTKIAQARIAYGGRGQITDVQQPRYGQQLVDILLPF
ncbi:flagellar basal body L-ring protein FlgH [Methylobacterium persicinum]|uniref:Flagellar L-ring protein n=1 Tax=Methylobacterium persicinum TaxID=374426 RepID=A0ABU0HIF5_9HYPH|nr:flagellar basal body L-ring protein FlgH [Methylobacterium persicinum]MDQ0442111.1 flagellar L-ring protein precursor FlgH [Methylobacterium persicinum]GJE38790.1 Flagellar L-ring protein [Methylobacterium persicinum]